ncbi:hypothetical protein [Sphingomonas sp. PAMC 26605]|uniref:hypothetical protein n=1 Tax=Sphingomonas sp. PAMC 26605 TaxID=1112214 RepID=UPI0002FD1C5D|nr:hypothetical protein [Sphingomonas sp. PAMC 26605]
MPEYLAPGVFVEEIERGPKPIEGVATSTAAFLGETERGPLRPQLITSYGESIRLYGEVFRDGAYLPHAMKAFFDNGGKRVYVTRIAGDAAEIAKKVLGKLTATALGPGDAYNRVWVRVDPGTTKVLTKPIGFRLQLAYWDRAVPGGVFDPFADPARLPRPSIVEDFDDLSLLPASPSFWEKRVNNGNSGLVELDVDPTATLDADFAATQSAALDGGANGDTPTSAHFEIPACRAISAPASPRSRSTAIATSRSSLRRGRPMRRR